MSLRRHLKSSMLLTGGTVASALCSFLRNIIVARLISVEDFGIAATFAMTMSLVEMASNLSLDRLLVQAPDGDEPRLQATAQAFQVLRSVAGAAVLLAIAGPVAALFGVPHLAWVYRVLAIVPLIRGLAHLDMARAQRRLRFGPAVGVDAGSQILATAIAAPLALWLGDYRVMLWVILAQVTSYTVISHLAADRRYVWAWDWVLIRRMFHFGWPLMLNGIIMFGIFQGDRAIIGATFTMEDLAYYSIAFSLTLMPGLVISKILQSYLIPLLARVQHDAGAFFERSLMTIQLCLLAAVLLAVGFWIAGPALLRFVYGDRYLAGAVVIGWLGLMQGARIAKGGAGIIAMARGDTRVPLWANLVRCVGILMALGAVAAGWGVEAIAISGLIGELLAFVASVLLLGRRFGMALRRPILNACAAGILVGVVALLTHTIGRGERAVLEVAVGTVAAVISVVILIPMFPELSRGLRRGAEGEPRSCPTPAAPESIVDIGVG